MKVSQTDEFQEKVSLLLVRNSNVLDILTKCQALCGKICRSSIKSATGCGCVKISAEKSLSVNMDEEFSSKENTGVEGTLCADCKGIIEDDIGEMVFYIASLCNALGLKLSEIMAKEIKNVEVLGKYSLK